jgi:uncharacterized membrane protein (UPF0127 family)
VHTDAKREASDAFFREVPKIPPKGYKNLLMSVLTTSDGTVIASQLEIADKPLKRMKGLLGRSSLSPAEGMLFRPAGSIHMFFMKIPLDVVFCDEELRVVKVVRDLQPWKTAGAKGAKVTIELGVGGAAGLQPGDQLAVRD